MGAVGRPGIGPNAVFGVGDTFGVAAPEVERPNLTWFVPVSRDEVKAR